MKKIGISLLILVTVTASVAYFYWKQVTKLPEWYSTNETIDQKQNSAGKLGPESTDEALELVVQPETEVTRKATSKPSTNNSKSVKVRLNEDELNQLVVSKVSKSVGTDKAVKGSNTTIKNGKVESGVVVNVSEISASQKLEQNQKAAIEKAIRAFPGFKDKEVYVGIEGKPKVKDGQLMFDDNTKIKLGNLSLTMAQLASRLGIPKDSLERSISLEIKKLRVDES